MTHEQIEQLKRERAIAINALQRIAETTFDYQVKLLAEQTIQECKS